MVIANWKPVVIATCVLFAMWGALKRLMPGSYTPGGTVAHRDESKEAHVPLNSNTIPTLTLLTVV